MRGQIVVLNKLTKGRHTSTDSYRLPKYADDKFTKALEQESMFRQIASGIKAYGSACRIFAVDSNDMASFVSEYAPIPIYDGKDDFRKIPVDSWKLAIFVKFEEDLVHDANFSFEKYLLKRLVRNFARAETNAFINGTGIDMPTGILCDSKGADVALTTDSLTYDNLIELYFSVKPEYRSKGVWLMNDETALALRKLKDDGGNYLWNSANDTILGKSVMISEFMPNAESGMKPVAFGDFSYYWVIDRRAVSMRPIVEGFTINGQIGYLAYELLDGKLIRTEAVKVLRIK